MKIALLGSAPSSANLAPYHDASWAASRQGMAPPEFQMEPFVDETWEIWGVSPGAFAYAQRASRWFEVHRWEPGQPWFQPAYIQFLRDFRGPVYTGGPIPEIKNHVVYPIERVEAEFSAYFLHSSLSLMMALAILEIEDARRAPKTAEQLQDILDGAPEEKHTIGLWGVDMAANEEYGDQRSGCHFFILEAARRGIELYIPAESCLLRPKPIYGLSEWNHDYIKATAKMREYNQRQAHFMAQKAEAEAQLATLSGAAGDLTYWINTWTNPYGIPSGIKFQIAPGTGLGGGTTHPRPQTAYVQDRIDNGPGSGGGVALVEEVAVEHNDGAKDPTAVLAGLPEELRTVLTGKRKRVRTPIKATKKKAARRR